MKLIYNSVKKILLQLWKYIFSTEHCRALFKVRVLGFLPTRSLNNSHGFKGGMTYVWFRAYLLFLLVVSSDFYDDSVFFHDEG